MDDKRTFLAIGLAIAILLAWTPLAEHMGWIQRPQPVATTQETAAPTATAPAPAPASQAAQLPVFTPSAGVEVKVETPLYSAVLYSGGGTLRSFTLKRYDETIKPDSPKVNLVSPDAALTAPLGLTVNASPRGARDSGPFRGAISSSKRASREALRLSASWTACASPASSPSMPTTTS